MKTIKRYANRKLYDTERSSYVTLDEIAEMVRTGEDLEIVDQKTGEDLTSVTLTQIIFEEEKRSKRILPLPALRNIIQSGGDFLQRVSQPVQQFKEETQSVVDRFFKAGEERLDGGRQAIREFTNGLQRTIDDLQVRVDQRVKDAVDNLTHVPDLDQQLEEVRERLQSLEAQMTDLVRTVSRLWDAKEDSASSRYGRSA